MGLVKFTEFPEYSITPPFFSIGQLHFACFIDQNSILSIEIFSNKLKLTQEQLFEMFAMNFVRTNASRISPSQMFMRLGNTSNSNSVQTPISISMTKESFKVNQNFFRILTLTSSEIVNDVCYCLWSSATFIFLTAPALHLEKFTVRCISMVGFCANLIDT